MKSNVFFTALVALAGLAGAGSVQALTTADFAAFSVSYDASTSFTEIDFSFDGGGGSTGFGWNVDPSVNVISFGAPTSVPFALPAFTINVKPGWTLSGPVTGFIGNLVFNEVGAGASTSASVAGLVSVDGSPALPFGGALSRVPSPTPPVPGYTGGTFMATQTVPVGGFSSFNFSGGTLTLAAGGGFFSSIVGQSQNQLSIGLVAIPVPVPEPETAALLLAGLLTLGSLSYRRSRS